MIMGRWAHAACGPRVPGACEVNIFRAQSLPGHHHEQTCSQPAPHPPATTLAPTW